MRAPSSLYSFRLSLASSASLNDSMLMKPKPLDRPVPRSHISLQLSTLPYLSNNSSSDRSVVSKFKPNTPKHLLGPGPPPPLARRLRGDLLLLAPLRDLERDLERDL